MQQINSQVSEGKKPIRILSPKEMFNSPIFYYTLLPHIISIALVIIDDLPYSYAYIIFYLNLIVDTIFLSLSILFTKKEEVQKMYKSKRSKLFLAARSLILGLAMCLFFGIFGYVIFFFTTLNLSIIAALTNKIVLLSVAIYSATKMIKLVKNISQYNSGQQSYIEQGESFISNLITIMIVVMFIFPAAMFLPGILFQIFKNYQFMNIIPLIAIIFIFALKAYIDAALAVIKKEMILKLVSKKPYSEN